MSFVKSDNAYAGGITYSTPSIFLGGSGSMNGGYSFDLPLATVAAFNNQGLSFLADNSENARGFFNSVFEASNNAMTRTENSAFRLADRGLSAMINVSRYSIDASERINQINQTEATNRVNAMPEPSSGWCFITTAVCEAENLPDDCYELTVLRKFRDGYMSKFPEMVKEYYKIAPSIVAKLKSFPDGGVKVFADIKERYLLPAIAAIESDSPETALSIYVDMVKSARKISESS